MSLPCINFLHLTSCTLRFQRYTPDKLFPRQHHNIHFIYTYIYVLTHISDNCQAYETLDFIHLRIQVKDFDFYKCPTTTSCQPYQCRFVLHSNGPGRIKFPLCYNIPILRTMTQSLHAICQIITRRIEKGKRGISQ